MAKQFDLKGPAVTGGLPTYRKQDQSADGGESLTPADWRARNGRGQSGLGIARHIVVKPTASSGSLGSNAQPFKKSRGYEDQQTGDNPILRKTKIAKPNN